MQSLGVMSRKRRQNVIPGQLLSRKTRSAANANERLQTSQTETMSEYSLEDLLFGAIPRNLSRRCKSGCLENGESQTICTQDSDCSDNHHKENQAH